jgi:hypothetical protein
MAPGAGAAAPGRGAAAAGGSKFWSRNAVAFALFSESNGAAGALAHPMPAREKPRTSKNQGFRMRES